MAYNIPDGIKAESARQLYTALCAEYLRVHGVEDIPDSSLALIGDVASMEQIKQRLAGEEFTPPTIDERIGTGLRHYDMLLTWKPRRVAVNEMRKHIGWYVHGMRGAAQLRGKINTMDDPDQVKQTLLAFAEEAKADQE